MVFVIAAEKMSFRGKGIDNIMASFLTKDIWHTVPVIYFYLPRKLEAHFLLPAKILILLVVGKA